VGKEMFEGKRKKELALIKRVKLIKESEEAREITFIKSWSQ